MSTNDVRKDIYLMKTKERMINYLLVEIKKQKSDIGHNKSAKEIEPLCGAETDAECSHIYGVQTPLEMVRYIDDIIHNELCSRCIVANVFFDLDSKEGKDVDADNGTSASDCSSVQIPYYTYTI